MRVHGHLRGAHGTLGCGASVQNGKLNRCLANVFHGQLSSLCHVLPERGVSPTEWQ